MRSHLNSRLWLGGISPIAVAALLVAPPALAQASSSLRGTVAGAAAGTTVTVTDVNTGQRISAQTNATGVYVIPGLRPGTYRVETAGRPTQNVVVPVGLTITYDIPAAAPAGETPVEDTPVGGTDIVVTGTRQQEVRSATVSTSVSQVQIENLPQNDRNFLNFAALAPGVSVSPSAGARRVQAGATSADNINVFIDGLSLKNPVNHGGVAGQNFSLGNPFPQSAIQEFKVDTQNFKAEYEQAGSAIITAVTKTGGNEFHGGAFGEWQPKAFIGRPYFDRAGNANNPNGTIAKPDYNRWQYGADLGGPIIADKLHFFAAFEATDQRLPADTINLQTSQGVPQAIADQYNGNAPKDFQQRLYFGKLTFFASDQDTVNISSFLRRESNLSDFGGTGVPEHGHFLESKNDLYQFEWTRRGDDFLNEFTVAYQKVFNGTPRVSQGPEILLSSGTNFDTIAALGANSFEQYDRQRTLTVKNNITLTRDTHVIKGGVRLAVNKLSREEDNRGNGTYYFQGPSYTSFDASTPYGASISTIPVQPARTTNTQVGVFIQDDWTPDEHWTINAGIRWDFETDAKNEDFVTPPAIANALRNYAGWQAAGIDPEDYITNGDQRKPYWKAFQPRLGVSYDVNGDRDLIIFAGAGRYYDRPLFITAGIETLKSYYQSVSTVSFCDGTGLPTCASVAAGNGGTLPRSYVAYNPALKDVENLRATVTALGTGGDVWLLNNDTKLPYSDQFNIGIRKRFGQVQTSIAFSHIRSHNIFQFVRGNRYSNGWYTRVLQKDAAGNVIGCTDGGNTWIQDQMPDIDYAACPATQGDLPGYNGKLNIGRNDGKAVYNAIYITAEKPYSESSGWGFTTSLTLQRPRTNVAQELGSDEFYNGPDQTAYGWQYVPGTEKYRFVGTGIVRLPLDVKFSGTLTLGSGPAFGNIITGALATGEAALNYGNLGGRFHPKETFAYSNLDLRLAKNFSLPWGHDFEVSFAAFNVFDTVNRNYSAWGAGSGLNPTFEENGTVGNARSFQAGVKYRF